MRIDQASVDTIRKSSRAAFLDSTEDPYATEWLRRGVPSHSQLRVKCAFGAGNASDSLYGPFRGLAFITGQCSLVELGTGVHFIPEGEAG